MTGSVALDVVIGLVFIYLLYSLLATVLAEIISTHLGLRSKNLREAIDRMLNDEKATTWFKDLFVFFNVFFKPKNGTINKFYNHQEIKYLGQSALRDPSSIKSGSFSKVLMDLIKQEGSGDREIDQVISGLKNIASSDRLASAQAAILGPETAAYVKSILEDCQHDLDKFRTKLEDWFDTTMRHTTEWYKRRVQVILFAIGFVIAWSFNVDTFTIVKKLSDDPDARDKMVQLAAAYIENGSYEKVKFITVDTVALKADTVAWKEYKVLMSNYNQRMDTLTSIQKQLRKDINSANMVLGLGSMLPDSIKTDEKGMLILPDWVDAKVAQQVIHFCASNDTIGVTGWQKFWYFIGLLFTHFWGYIITALAISMGAPFWFDMLNKLMKLRGNMTSATQPSSNASKETKNQVSNINRVG